MELYLIRHGQSTNNALMQNQEERVSDPDLTEIGWQQAKLVAKFLKDSANLEYMTQYPVDAPERLNGHSKHTITHLYCSAMLRAMQTAKPIGEALGIQPEIWVDVHEHGGVFLKQNGLYKGFTGKTYSEIKETFPDYVIYDPKVTENGWWNPEWGMEQISGCYNRAIQVAKDLNERFHNPSSKDDKIAIVSHGIFIDALIKAIVGTLPTVNYKHWHSNTSITRIDYMPVHGIVIRYINRVTHLPPELVT